LTYAIEIRNVGDVTVQDVELTDAPDAHTTLVAGTVHSSRVPVTVTDGNDLEDTTVTVSVGTLLSGETVLLAFDVTINTPAGAAKTDPVFVAKRDQVDAAYRETHIKKGTAQRVAKGMIARRSSAMSVSQSSHGP
jgi:uncharacterized repeat protein (TIGR01451 family)